MKCLAQGRNVMSRPELEPEDEYTDQEVAAPQIVMYADQKAFFPECYPILTSTLKMKRYRLSKDNFYVNRFSSVCLVLMAV